MCELEGKKVAIFYDDFGKVSRKDGVITAISEQEYILDSRIIIPKHRVVRVEVQR